MNKWRMLTRTIGQWLWWAAIALVVAEALALVAYRLLQP
jgi:hypothetical protein